MINFQKNKFLPHLPKLNSLNLLLEFKTSFEQSIFELYHFVIFVFASFSGLYFFC